MLPRDFWAGAAGDILSMIFGAFVALFLAPLSGITSSVINLFTQVPPQ